MSRSPKQRMMIGDWYSCLDPELEAMRDKARAAVHEHNTLAPGMRGAIGPLLASLLGEVAAGVLIEAPFHCAYGVNIALGADVYLNAGCTILDTAPVQIGAASMLGPQVQIYCAVHHKDPTLRTEGLERARPVTIGTRVWIGGGAILLPGVTVGDAAIVGAGSVVTHDVAPGLAVVGNPARPITAGTGLVD